MKLVGNKVGLLVRLGLMSGAMLFTQQALAVGTAAGTSITNTATVDYFVGGVDQPDINSNTVEFVVDRNVNFTLTPVGGALVDVTPGGNDYFVDFLLTNLSNSPLDFDLVLDQLTGGDVRGPGTTDDADMEPTTLNYAVNDVLYTGSEPFNPTRGSGAQFVDELGADDAIRIRVWADAPLTLTDGQIAGVSLEATAKEAGAAGIGADLTEDADTALGVENVFADADNDAIETALDGFIVASADLTVAKSYTVISDPVGGTSPIPGAVIEYTITITNASSTTAAETVSISDTLDANVELAEGAYGGTNDVEIDAGGGPTYCDADPAVTDGCGLASGTLSVGSPAIATVAASSTLTVKFQVTILNPATTP